MKNIVIIGAGDLGKEVVWLIEDINKYNPTYVILGFLDDDKNKECREFYGYRVLGDTNYLESLAKKIPLCAVIAIQNGSIRKRIKEAHNGFDNWESIVHPSSVIASSSSVAKGSIVFPHVTVSVDTKLGEFDLLYINSSICNDCKIGNYVSLMSGTSVSERAEIGDESFLSVGSTVYPNKKFGCNVTVGFEATACKEHSDGSEVSE